MRMVYLSNIDLVGLYFLNLQLLSFPFRYFDIIWYGYIANQDGVSYAKMIALLVLCLSYLPLANFISEIL